MENTLVRRIDRVLMIIKWAVIVLAYLLAFHEAGTLSWFGG